MNISIDIKRLALTTFVCFVTAIIPYFIMKGGLYDSFITACLFSIAIPLTNMDRITTGKRWAFFLSGSMTFILFFPILFLYLFYISHYSYRSFGFYLPYAMCVITGLLRLFINRVFIKIDNIKLGLIVTGFFTLTIPLLTTFFNGDRMSVKEFIYDPSSYVLWQTITGLAIAISIWTKTSITTEKA